MVEVVVMQWIEHQPPALGDSASVGVVAYLGHAADGRYDSPHHGLAEPQAYRVDTPTGSPPLRTHFHTVDQFQYIGWGAGRIGGHNVAAGCVHYADGFTPYGPLRAADGGYSYLTLRATTDMGISYMPDSQPELRQALERRAEPGDRRSFTLDLRGEGGRATASSGWTRLVDDPDGLVVAIADTPAHETLAVPPVRGGGAYLVVVAGGVDDDDGPRGAGSVRWCPAGASPAVSAGPAGARVALLAFADGGVADGAPAAGALVDGAVVDGAP
jgi:hypothetical protein